MFVNIGERLQGPVNDENTFWFGSYLVQSILDLVLAFLLMYGFTRLMLWAYGGKRKDMKARELLILLMPSVSGVFAYECDFHYPRSGKVNAFDVSIILNNALRNAIEAVEKEGNVLRVSLSSHCMKNMYIIEVANSYTGELVIDAAYIGRFVHNQ